MYFQCINFYHIYVYTVIRPELETRQDGSNDIDASICRVLEPRAMYWSNGVRRRTSYLSVVLLCGMHGRVNIGLKEYQKVACFLILFGTAKIVLN